jgi:hypothetical protein
MLVCTSYVCVSRFDITFMTKLEEVGDVNTKRRETAFLCAPHTYASSF